MIFRISAWTWGLGVLRSAGSHKSDEVVFARRLVSRPGGFLDTSRAPPFSIPAGTGTNHRWCSSSNSHAAMARGLLEMAIATIRSCQIEVNAQQVAICPRERWLEFPFLGKPRSTACCVKIWRCERLSGRVGQDGPPGPSMVVDPLQRRTPSAMGTLWRETA